MPSRKSRLRAPIQVPASVVMARAMVGARTMADVTIGWFAGVDWGSQRHQACILDRGGAILGERAFPHGGAGLAALCDWLVSIAGDAGAVAVGVEGPPRAAGDGLVGRGVALAGVHPKRLAPRGDRPSVLRGHA